MLLMLAGTAYTGGLWVRAYLGALLVTLVALGMASLVPMIRGGEPGSQGATAPARALDLGGMIKAYVYAGDRLVADPPTINVFWLIGDLLGAGHPLITSTGQLVTVNSVDSALRFIRDHHPAIIVLGNESTPGQGTGASGGLRPDTCSYSVADDPDNSELVAVITCYYDRVYNSTKTWLQIGTSSGPVVLFYTDLEQPLLINKSYVTYRIELRYSSGGVVLKGLMELVAALLTGRDTFGSWVSAYNGFAGIGGALSASSDPLEVYRSQYYYNKICLGIYRAELLDNSSLFVTVGGAGGCPAGQYSYVDIIVQYFYVVGIDSYFIKFDLVKIPASVNYGGASDSYYASLVLRWG